MIKKRINAIIERLHVLAAINKKSPSATNELRAHKLLVSLQLLLER